MVDGCCWHSFGDEEAIVPVMALVMGEGFRDASEDDGRCVNDVFWFFWCVWRRLEV